MTRSASMLMTVTFLMQLPKVATAQHVSFFPVRPRDAIVGTFTGTIERYAIGTGRGELAVANHGHVTTFAMSYPYKINGRIIRCHQAPRPAYRPPKFVCSDWPSSVILGRSEVRVNYWTTMEQGSVAKASDSLTTVP